MRQLFLTSSVDMVLDDIVKNLSQTPEKYKLAFINTASEVEEGDHWWVTADRNKLVKLGFNVDEFSITDMDQGSIEEKLKDKNGIFVCGGNTFYLLDQIIKTGFDKVLKGKIDEGYIYIGSSAGSMIVGKRVDLVSTIDDRSKAPGLKSGGLELVDFALLPHWGNSDFKEEYRLGFDSMYCEDVKIIPLSNNQYLFVQDDNFRLIQV